MAGKTAFDFQPKVSVKVDNDLEVQLMRSFGWFALAVLAGLTTGFALYAHYGFPK